MINFQPVTDGKLNPFNVEWSVGYFELCDPIPDGDFESVYFTIVHMSFHVFCIASVDGAVLVVCTGALASTFSRVCS